MNNSKNKLNSEKKNGFLSQQQTQPKKKNKRKMTKDEMEVK